jgi:hypothetical protein
MKGLHLLPAWGAWTIIALSVLVTWLVIRLLRSSSSKSERAERGGGGAEKEPYPISTKTGVDVSAPESVSPMNGSVSVSGLSGLEAAGHQLQQAPRSASSRYIELCVEIQGSDVNGPRRIQIGHIPRNAKVLLFDLQDGKRVRAEVIAGSLFDGPKIEIHSSLAGIGH